jgi:hypothetical protein
MRPVLAAPACCVVATFVISMGARRYTHPLTFLDEELVAGVSKLGLVRKCRKT